MAKNSNTNNSTLLDFIIKNPSRVQDIFIGKNHEDIYASYIMAIENLEFGSAVVAIAGLADFDLRGASDNQFGRGSIFSEFMEMNNEWDATFGHQEAKALGTVIGYWMANKPTPKTHYWAQHALSLTADIAVIELGGNISFDPAEFPMMSLLQACHVQLVQSDRTHHVKPFITAFSSQFREGQQESFKNIEKAMAFLSADIFFQALAYDVIIQAVDGDIYSWQTLVNIYCADAVLGIDFKNNFDSALREMNYCPSSFLFNICDNLLSPAYNQPYTVKTIRDFVINNEGIRPRLAGHISNEKDIDLIAKKLNLEIGTLFKKEDMPRSARRALLSGDLNL
jgi:hypothetical protein